MFNKKFVTILSVLVAVIVIGGIIVVLVDLTQNDINDKVINQVENESEVITSDIDTSDWLTYRNEEFGFEVRYPQSWKYVVTELGQIKFYNTQEVHYLEGSETYLISIGVNNVEHNFNFENWIKEWSDTRKKYGGFVRKVIFNDLEAIQGSDYIGTQTVIFLDNKIYSINQVNLGSSNINLEIENIYNALLNSWKFIN